jgi:hypothetical protein
MNLDELFMMLFDREKYLQLMKKKTPLVDDTGYGDFEDLRRGPRTMQGLREYDRSMVLPSPGMPINPWQPTYQHRMPPIETQRRRGIMPRPRVSDLEIMLEEIDRPSGKSF